MRIAVISDVIYPWVKGGAEMRYYELYRRIAKIHDVHYFTMQFPQMPKHFTHEGIKVHCICRAPPSLYMKGKRKIFPALRFTLFLFFALIKYRFDVIDSNEFPLLPNIVLKLYRWLRPNTLFISTWHEWWSYDYWRQYLGSILGLVGFLTQWIALMVADRIVVVSDYTADRLYNKFGSSKQVHVVWNGVDYQQLMKAREEVQPKPKTLIFVGRLIPEKRVHDLIFLFEELCKYSPNLSLIILGDGPERARLEALSKNLGIRFLGAVPNHLDVLREIAGSSIYVSMSIREGFNLSALEACELGIPAFVRLVCFKHPNLRMIGSNVVEEIQDLLEKGPKPTPPSGDFSWDLLAEQLVAVLRESY